MARKSFFSILLLLGLLTPLSAWAEEGSVYTLWPVFDYRRSEALDYRSLNLFGPLLKYESKGEEREFGLRPLFFRAEDGEEKTTYSEILYPVASRKSSPDQTAFQGVRLLNYDFGEPEEGSENEFTLFPFLFYGEHEEKGRYAAIFPLGGKIYELLGRDEIRFALFPLYGRTLKKGTEITNLLWPIYARVRGEKESGLKLWPLFGYSDKEGVYRKRFYLWPIVFRDDLRLDTENPLRRRTFFPLYVAEDSPKRTSRVYLWPFFTYLEDREKDYERWDFPWPLLGISRGKHRQGERFLPLFSDERIGDLRKRWFLWPLFKSEETRDEALERRHKRVLFFLYSDLEEKRLEEEGGGMRRTLLLPLFGYERQKGVSHFYTLALLEPFFPGSRGIERNWAPLWRLYQRKWDRQGNEISSLLWNLYWKERRGEDLAMELFPIFSYWRQEGKTDLRLLKGIFRLRRGEEGTKINLFYLPWAIKWGRDRQSTAGARPSEAIE